MEQEKFAELVEILIAWRKSVALSQGKEDELSVSAPSLCWLLCWNWTLSNRQKNQLFQADREVGLLFVLISHQCMRSSKIYLPECWLKELIFLELSYSPFSSNALDKHFELGAR